MFPVGVARLSVLSCIVVACLMLVPLISGDLEGELTGSKGLYVCLPKKPNRKARTDFFILM